VSGVNRRTFLALAGAGTVAIALPSCANQRSRDPNVIRYWGMGAADADKDQAVADAFAQTPQGEGIRVAISQVPSSGAADMSQIITAVRGGTAPDLWWIDRFNTVQTASIGLLEPLDPWIEEFEGVSADEFKRQWISFAVDEVTYDGQLYGLPTATDARGVLYNEDLVREIGIDLDMLDPAQHVLTWAEMADIAEQCVEMDGKGNYTRFGFAPWLDQGGSPYTYAFGAGAAVYDNATATTTLDTDEWVKVYELYTEWVERFPYDRVDAFFATYQPPNAPPAQTALFGEQLAMTPTGPWQIQGNEKYAPQLSLQWTWLPVWDEADPTYTWSGGQGLVFPRGTQITRTLWEYMKFAAGGPGQSIYQPLLGNLPTHLQTLADGAYNPKAQFFADMMESSTSRPPLPVGSAAWDALDRARQSVTLGSASPSEAAATAQAFVAPKMDLFPDFRMPETYGQPIDLTPPPAIG
jgi:multiple sugar transport system substrate-binding protein